MIPYCHVLTSEECFLVGEVEGPEVHDGRDGRRLPVGEDGRPLRDRQLRQDDRLDHRPHRDGAEGTIHKRRTYSEVANFLNPDFTEIH